MTDKQLGFIIKPPTIKASLKTAELLKDKKFEAIFLNLPRAMDELVVEYLFGASYEEILEDIRRKKILPEPVEAWLKEIKPILDMLRDLKSDVCTFCYRDNDAFEAEAKSALDIVLLTLRDSIRDDVSVKSWIEILSRRAQYTNWLEKEIDYIVEEMKNYEESICISSFEGKKIKRQLEGIVKTWVTYVDLPYHFTPLEILSREISSGKIDEERVKKLVKEHIRFIRDLVIPKDLDTALEQWKKKNLYWLLGKD